MSEIGHINISITENEVMYDSEFTIPEVVFWLRVIETMILKRTMATEEA